jgi:hypothetical protein
MSKPYILPAAPIAMALLLAAACGGPMRTGTTSKPAHKPDADGTCAAGLTVCGTGDFGVCVDLQSDRAHCGACDRACTQGIACEAGACQQVACKSTPTFSNQAAPASSAVPNVTCDTFVLADVNGDGHLDEIQVVAVADPGTTFTVSLGLAGGGFGEAQAYHTELDVMEITVDDVNHDGIDDLVLMTHVFVCAEEWLGARDGVLKRAPATGVTGCLNTMTMADLSGDGRLDVVAPYKDGGLIVYLSDSLGVLQQSKIYPSSNSQIFRMFVRDWNGDGAPDIVALSSPIGASGDKLQIFYNRGDGTFLDLVDCGIDVSDVFTAQVTDLDHDGNQDLITTSATGVGVLLGRGGCSFGSVKSYPAPGSYKESRLADLDGDGNLDLVLVANPARVSVFLSNPDGTLRPLPPVALGNTEPMGVVIGDIDGDKRPDVAVTDLTGHTQILGGQCP